MRTFRDPEHGSKPVPYGPQVKKSGPLYGSPEEMQRGQMGVSQDPDTPPPPVPTEMPEGYQEMVDFIATIASLTYYSSDQLSEFPPDEIQALGVNPSEANSSGLNFFAVSPEGYITLNTENIWAQALVALGYLEPGVNLNQEQYQFSSGNISRGSVIIAALGLPSDTFFGFNLLGSLLSDAAELPEFSFLSELSGGSFVELAQAINYAFDYFYFPVTTIFSFYDSYYTYINHYFPQVDDAWIEQLAVWAEENQIDLSQGLYDPSTGDLVNFTNYFGEEWVFVPETVDPEEPTELPAGYQDVIDALRYTIENQLFLNLTASGAVYEDQNSQHVVVQNPDGTWSLNGFSYAAQLLVATGMYSSSHVFPVGTFSTSSVNTLQFLLDTGVIDFNNILEGPAWWSDLEDTLTPDMELALSFWDANGDGDLDIFSPAGTSPGSDGVYYLLANDGLGDSSPETLATYLNALGFDFVDTTWVEQLLAYYSENGLSTFAGWYDPNTGTFIQENFTGSNGWAYEPPPPITPEDFNNSLLTWILAGNTVDLNNDGVAGSDDLLNLLTELTPAQLEAIFGPDVFALTQTQQADLFGSFVSLYNNGFPLQDGTTATWLAWNGFIEDPQGFGVTEYSEYEFWFDNYSGTSTYGDYVDFSSAGYSVSFDEYLLYLAWEESATPSALTPPEGTDLPTQTLSDYLSVLWANGQDLNGDGTLDNDDSAVYQNQILAGISVGDPAFDFNEDGAVNFNDYFEFSNNIGIYGGTPLNPATNVTPFSNANGWWNADGEWVSFEGAVFGPYAGSSAEVMSGDYTFLLEGEYDPSFAFAWTFLNENFSPMSQADYDGLLSWWNSLTPTIQQSNAAGIIDNPLGEGQISYPWEGLFDFTGDGIVDDNELTMAFYLLYGNPVTYTDWQGNEQSLVEDPAGSPPPTGEAPPPTTSSAPPPAAMMGGGDPEYPYVLSYDQMYDLDAVAAAWPPDGVPEWYQGFWDLIEPWVTTYDIDWNQTGNAGTPGGPYALGNNSFNLWWNDVSDALGIDVDLYTAMVSLDPTFDPVENPPAWADVVADGVFDLADLGTMATLYSPYFSIASVFQNHPDSEWYNPTGIFAGAGAAYQAMQQIWIDMGLTADNLWEIIYLEDGWGLYDPEVFMAAIAEYGPGEYPYTGLGWQSTYYYENAANNPNAPDLLNGNVPLSDPYFDDTPFNLGVGGWEQVAQGFGVTNFLDLLAQFGGSDNLEYDLNEDGFVGTDDLLAFLAGYSTGNVWQPSEISPDISGSIYDNAEYTVDEDPVVTEEQTYEGGGMILKKKR